MADSSPSSPSQELAKRLDLTTTKLVITMSATPIDDLIAQSDSDSSIVDQLVRTLYDCSYAHVPISPRPGTGENYVHRLSGPPRDTSTEVGLCCATAKMLDLQTLLELPLAILGISMQPTERDHLWPDMSRLDKISVLRIPRSRSVNSTPEPEELSPSDIKASVWDFARPLDLDEVYIYLQLKPIEPKSSSAVKSRPSMAPELAKLYWKAERRRLSVKLPSRLDKAFDLSAQKFKDQIEPQHCIISRSLKTVDGCHIMPRHVERKLVVAALHLLFSRKRYPVERGQTKPLFYEVASSLHTYTPDQAENGVMLTPSLHRVLDTHRRFWILRGKCYPIGLADTLDELFAFEPPCPSLHMIRSIKQQSSSHALWEQQLAHEEVVQPLQCQVLGGRQAFLHVNALLSFFTRFMVQLPWVQKVLRELDQATDADEDARSDKNEAPKKMTQKRSRANTGPSEEPHAPESGQPGPSGRGATDQSGGPEQQLSDESSDHSSHSKLSLTNQAPSTSTSATTNGSSQSSGSAEGSPPSKRRRETDNKTLFSGDTTDSAASSSEGDNATSEYDSDGWDEEEERKQELTRNDTLALILTLHALRSGPGTF
ncbi:hypothetical protein OC846_004872 [Tilletia horrida]|uniref:Uncharacterized protein n=1 Tax=Tilletia horrida TaxID=155126 RepID=A0AAN6GP03_9BASI|nr:hypothetical protein OC846_004872 [Tilletia horrida]